MRKVSGFYLEAAPGYPILDTNITGNYFEDILYPTYAIYVQDVKDPSSSCPAPDSDGSDIRQQERLLQDSPWHTP